MELTGTVVRVVPTIERGGKPIDKIHVEFADNPSYPQTLEFEAYNKPGIFESFGEGDSVKLAYDLRGREWQKDASSEVRVFNTLSCFSATLVEKGSKAPKT